MRGLDADVVIAGAGPCGLMLANELGRRGISALVVDQEPTVATAPQANATQARSMEHYRRLGFAEEIRALGMPSDHPTDVAYFTTFTGYELARHRMPSSGEAAKVVRQLSHIWNGAELPHRVPQSVVEQTLLRHASGLQGIEFRFSTRLVGFEDRGDCVICALVDTANDREYKVSCRYLFAADGAQSLVRKGLGIRFAGEGPAARDFMGGQMLSIYLHAPAFYDVVAGERAWMYWTFNRRRRALLATVDGQGAFVLQTQLRPGENAESMSELEAGQLFLQAVGREIPFKVTGIASWVAGRALVAERFSQGRILLGGDAVHLFTPTGGMGYNTAIEDAVNAGWKLAAVMTGSAPEGLLASYDAERRPIAQRNTRFAIDFANSIGLYVPSPAIEDEGKSGREARARAGAYLGNHGAHEFTIPGFTFGGRYDGSPVVAEEESPVPPDAPCVYVPSAKPGGRAPHAWLSDGTSLFDRFGFEWTLLQFGRDEATVNAFKAAAHTCGIKLTVLDLFDEAVAADLYERRFALIRPDQIVAWRGDGVEGEKAEALLKLALAREPTLPTAAV